MQGRRWTYGKKRVGSGAGIDEEVRIRAGGGDVHRLVLYPGVNGSLVVRDMLGLDRSMSLTHKEAKDVER